jgi:hypothetical protein
VRTWQPRPPLLHGRLAVVFDLNGATELGVGSGAVGDLGGGHPIPHVAAADDPAAPVESSRAAADSSPTSPGRDLDAARWLMREVSRCRLSTAHGAWPATRLHRGRDIDTVVVVLRFASEPRRDRRQPRRRCGHECFTEADGHAGHPPGSRARAVEWSTPGQASYAPPRDFAQRHPAADVEEFDTFPRCVRDGTPPGVTGRDALAAFDLAVAANWSGTAAGRWPSNPSPLRAGSSTRSRSRDG